MDKTTLLFSDDGALGCFWQVSFGTLIKNDVLVHTNFDKNELIIYLLRSPLLSSSFTLYTDFNTVKNLISFKAFRVHHFFNCFNQKIRIGSLPIYILDCTALFCVGWIHTLSQWANVYCIPCIIFVLVFLCFCFIWEHKAFFTLL